MPCVDILSVTGNQILVFQCLCHVICALFAGTVLEDTHACCTIYYHFASIDISVSISHCQMIVGQFLLSAW